MRLRYRSLVCLVFVGLSEAVAQKSIPEDIRHNLIDEQKSVVSILSGEAEITDGKKLRRRWTDKEKRMARDFLRAMLAGLGTGTQEHSYKVNLAHVRPSRNPLKGTNLFLNIPASMESTEYVILGAHYDTVSERAQERWTMQRGVH